MGLPATLILMIVCAAAAAACRWHETRQRPLGEVSLFPSTLVMAIAVLAFVLATAHLVSLITGVPLKGRMAL